MTTASEVKQLVQPLLERNSDLGLAGRLVIMLPLQNFMVGIFVDRTGPPEYFRPIWSVNALCNPKHSFTLSFGAEIYSRTSCLWDRSGIDIKERLANQIEEDVLPLLRQLTDFERTCEFLLTYPFNWGPVTKDATTRVFLDVARGDWKMADKICSAFVSTYHNWKGTYDVTNIEPIALTLAPLVAARDRAGIASVLHGWEAITVKKMKLGKFWTPTPFPLENADVAGKMIPGA